ncbi:hypothetical protein RRG08_012974 [Elysia crispata]|uniref:Uncharacterized protein n=1 Tax=Elysia crispata TaxID=231223 RepID=A0AAE1A154_9GAST|nr:hypothetical protein RRG08_012974 [Elysia crispata]
MIIILIYGLESSDRLVDLTLLSRPDLNIEQRLSSQGGYHFGQPSSEFNTCRTTSDEMTGHLQWYNEGRPPPQYFTRTDHPAR